MNQSWVSSTSHSTIKIPQMDGTFLKNLKKNSSSVYIYVYIVHINQCSELSELLDLELWRKFEILQ